MAWYLIQPLSFFFCCRPRWLGQVCYEEVVDNQNLIQSSNGLCNSGYRPSLPWWRWALMRKRWWMHSEWTTTSRMQQWVSSFVVLLGFCDASPPTASARELLSWNNLCVNWSRPLELLPSCRSSFFSTPLAQTGGKLKTGWVPTAPAQNKTTFCFWKLVGGRLSHLSHCPGKMVQGECGSVLKK